MWGRGKDGACEASAAMATSERNPTRSRHSHASVQAVLNIARKRHQLAVTCEGEREFPISFGQVVRSLTSSPSFSGPCGLVLLLCLSFFPQCNCLKVEDFPSELIIAGSSFRMRIGKRNKWKTFMPCVCLYLREGMLLLTKYKCKILFCESEDVF